ncbi:uncharacterized protein PF3D7_1120600 isoform X3 [Halyomorpha halys]|uniref:uncharacterized protein PF3D7_1120600 isoform X3 n=1 Tax=Halyomorpha halys TaxID=286706 RepID=UPI0006D5021C|nr:uncharacterized protein LOC106677134 isoform X3 [Halyomorpha halys]
MVNYKKLGKLLIWRCKQKKVGSQLPTATMAEIEETEPVPSILLPCASCSRTFRPEALAKHSKVCEKILMRKRKQFDSSKQRLQGTEIESFVLQTVPKTSRKKESQLNLSKSKWKEKVEQVRAVQAIKKSSETPISSQVVKPSDHEECPYCGRSFGPKAYERHTEFCKEQLHKLKVSNNTNSEARERLKVRTTYRGPLTNKVLNRDRYQPNRNRDQSPLGMSSSEIYVTDETPKSRGLSRNNSLRSSLRSKPEITPPPPLRRTMTQINPPTKGPRVIPKDMNETDLLQKTPTFNNKPRMISKEPIEKRMKPTNSKTIVQPPSKAAGSHPKSPPKLNNTDVNVFKELNVISCFTPGSSKSVNNLKLVNVVQGPINSETPSDIVSKSENEISDSIKVDDCFKPISDSHSLYVIQDTINSENILNAVPKSEIVTSELPETDNHSEVINDHPQSEVVGLNSTNDHYLSCEVQERTSETPLNVVPQSEIVTSKLPETDNHFEVINNHPQHGVVGLNSTNIGNRSKLLSDHHLSSEVQEIISKTPLSAVPQSEIVTSELPETDNHSEVINDHPQSEVVELNSTNDHYLSCEVQEMISETPLNVVSQCEINSHDLTKADYCFKPINDNNSSDVIQETMASKTPSKVVPKSGIEVLSSKDKFNLNNYIGQPMDNRKINFPPHSSSSLTEETNNQTDYTKSCNKNLAYTIEFEPDNRFLVYEHHTVGLKKSPIIFKKRISKNYELVKSFTNNNNNSADTEIQSNVTSESEEPLKNKNSLLINKVESSAPLVTQNCEIQTTETNDLGISNCNKVSLSWRERVLEIMEVSNSPVNKNSNTLPNKNSNQIDLCPVSGTVSVECQSDVVNNTNKPDSNDKYTDTDNSLLIDQEIIDIFTPNQKNKENFTDTGLHDDNIVHEIKGQKIEEMLLIDEKNNNSQNVGSSNDTEIVQDDFLDADLYFAEENNVEIGKMENDHSLDVDMYFVEENNVANEVLREETNRIKEVVENEQSGKESDLLADFDNKNVGNMKTNDLFDTIKVHSGVEIFDDSDPHLNDRYQSNKFSEEANLNKVEMDSLDSTKMASGIPLFNEYEFNVLLDLKDDLDKNQPEAFIKEDDSVENVASLASGVITPKIEKKTEYRSVSDSELRKKLFKENEVSKMVKRDLDSTYEIEDASNLRKTECEDSPTLKDKILRLAGEEFVLMANRNKECENFKGLQMDRNHLIDSEKKNMYSLKSPDNNLNHGSYKPNTYCRNTHTNSYNDSCELYSDIFSHLKRSNEEEPKVSSWQTLPHGSDSFNYESVSEKDSLDIKFEEDSGDGFYTFQPSPAFDGEVPFEAETFSNPFKDFSPEDATYSFSSSISSYDSGENQRSTNKDPIISQESLSADSLPPFIPSNEQSYKRSSSSRIPLLKSRRKDIYKSNTLPPLVNEPKTMSDKCGKQNNKKKSDFSQCYENLKNDSYTHFSNIKNSSEGSDSDWNLSDYDTYEKKKTVFTRSSKTVYNKYYEEVEYSQESNEFQTIKTSVSNLPLPHADFFKEKEFKLPKIQSKRAPFNQRVNKKKMMDFEKLPLLRNFEGCKCSSRKEKETDEDMENRNHKFLNNSIDSAYSRSSGADGDTGKAEMSKFCHECGAKYPIAGAKFCCNCGMRRITL